jgi:hypothetical protein
MNMKTFSKSLTGAIGCSISLFSLADVVVVVHPSNGVTIDKKSVQRIFLGKEKNYLTAKKYYPLSKYLSQAPWFI